MKRAPVLLVLVAALVCPTGTRADTMCIMVPSSSHSSIDRCIVTCPANDSVFAVTVRAPYCFPPEVFPVANADVVLDFTACADVVLATPDPPGLYQLLPSGWVLRVTNAVGRADFPLASGGTCSGPVRVYASGVLLASRPFVAAFDQDGDLMVTETDLALVQAKVGTSDLTADFDCDSAVTPSDYAIATAHLGHVHASVVGVGDSPALGLAIRPLSNPSRGRVEFELRSAERGHAQLSIHDLAGRRLATVLDGEIEPGMERVTWSGADANGRRVAAGLYFYRLVLAAQRAQGMVIIAR